MTRDDDFDTPPQAEILSRIKDPSCLKGLSLAHLERLAGEVRQQIIYAVSRNGGHLAPSLGVVDLTIALHYVFNAPEDRIIWDVGHQAYAHKLLTGRFDRFPTLRQHGGISGFPKRSESPYDCLDTGHASTSISAGLGMSVGKELRGDKSRVIAVIGDASLTGGMAFEALNQAGDLDKDLIVILNDNEMSISPNVGAISSYLSRKATGWTYFYFKRRFQQAVKGMKGLPSIDNLLHWARRWEDAFKSLFTPGMLFEAFKFDYIGPIDGHRIDQLIETLENVHQIRGPVLVHVLTTKGKGYKPAEDNPVHYHGVAALNGAQEPAPNGRPAKTYTEVFGQTMCRLAHREEKLVAITAAMPEGTGLKAFGRKFPDRTFDVGIAEQHAVALAAGLAVEGFIPVVAIYSTFMQRAYDQIIHDVCLPDLHVVLALDRGGIVGEDGPTHQGLFDLSFLRTGPKMVVIAPRDENILQHALNTAVGLDGPVALRYPRGRGSGVGLEPKLRTLTLGRGECLREGKDILLLPAGHMVAPVLEAAEELAKIGLKAAVVDPVFIKPLDSQLILDWAQTCGRVVTIEENVLAGGFGSGVGEMLADTGLTVPLKMIGIPDKFVEHGSQQVLRSVYGLDSAGIATVIKSWINGVVPRFRQAKAG